MHSNLVGKNLSASVSDCIQNAKDYKQVFFGSPLTSFVNAGLLKAKKHQQLFKCTNCKVTKKQLRCRFFLGKIFKTVVSQNNFQDHCDWF